MDELARWRAAGLHGLGAESRERKDDEGNLGDPQGSVNGNDGSAEAAPSMTAEKKGSAPIGGAVQSASANVMVLAATNAPEAVDAAFLRPGRFDEVKRRQTSSSLVVTGAVRLALIGRFAFDPFLTCYKYISL